MPRMKKNASLDDKISQRLEKTAQAAGLNVSAYPYLTALTKSNAPQPEDEQKHDQQPQSNEAE